MNTPRERKRMRWHGAFFVAKKGGVLGVEERGGEVWFGGMGKRGWELEGGG